MTENNDFKPMQEIAPRVCSASDERIVNNTMRHTYKILTGEEKAKMTSIKDKGAALLEEISRLGEGREISIAKTKVEEAVMWAVKALTA